MKKNFTRTEGKEKFSRFTSTTSRWDAVMWSNLKMTKAKERDLRSSQSVCKVNAKLNMNVVVCFIAVHVYKLMAQSTGVSGWK